MTDRIDDRYTVTADDNYASVKLLLAHFTIVRIVNINEFFKKNPALENINGNMVPQITLTEDELKKYLTYEEVLAFIENYLASSRYDSCDFLVEELYDDYKEIAARNFTAYNVTLVDSFIRRVAAPIYKKAIYFANSDRSIEKAAELVRLYRFHIEDNPVDGVILVKDKMHLSDIQSSRPDDDEKIFLSSYGLFLYGLKDDLELYASKKGLENYLLLQDIMSWVGHDELPLQ